MASEVMLSVYFKPNICCFRAAGALRRAFLPGSTVSVTQRSWRSTNVEEQTHTQEEIDEIDKLRNISRLPDRLYRKLEHVSQTPEPSAMPRKWFRKKTMRRLYARFGEKSGVDPAIMWPTKEELAEIKEEEKKWEPTLQEMWKNIADKRAEEMAERTAKEELVLKQMEKMPELIAKYKEKIKKEDAALEKTEAKRKALLEEAREFFGYKVDPKDPRFAQMQEKKAEEEEKERKKRKRAEREARDKQKMEYLIKETSKKSENSS